MENKIITFRDLEVWKLGHQLVLDVYNATGDFPKSETYRLTDQLCRAALSIPTNIAEGKGRESLKDYIHFLTIARGSIEETKSLLIVAKDLKLLPLDAFVRFDSNYEKLGKMLNSMIRSLKKRQTF